MKFLLYFFIFIPVFAESSDCVSWFLESGLTSNDKACESKCIVTPIDMGNFFCTDQCEVLCKTSITDQVLVYVPRLTEGDKEIVKRHPLDALKVYKKKQQVDELTKKIFKIVSRGDESDAFRHFCWSSLLTQELGSKKAKLFLDAHENDSTQSKEDKLMDVFNNSQGQDFVSSYKGKLSLDRIEKEALDRLKKDILKVNIKKYKKIPGGYYSK